MHSVTRSRWIAFPPEKVYQVLTIPDNLVHVVRRIESLQVVERQGEWGRAIARIDLPGGQWVDAEGTVEGVPGKELRFRAEQPFPIHNHWQFASEEKSGISGTQVNYMLEMDPGGMIAFLPGIVFRGFISAELDEDLKRLETLVVEATE